MRTPSAKRTAGTGMLGKPRTRSSGRGTPAARATPPDSPPLRRRHKSAAGAAGGAGEPPPSPPPLARRHRWGGGRGGGGGAAGGGRGRGASQPPGAGPRLVLTPASTAPLYLLACKHLLRTRKRPGSRS